MLAADIYRAKVWKRFLNTLKSLKELAAASAVRVFAGSLAFGSEELRGAADKRYLHLDLREGADDGVELLQWENPAG
jgi:hypothetical protein